MNRLCAAALVFLACALPSTAAIFGGGGGSGPTNGIDWLTASNLARTVARANIGTNSVAKGTNIVLVTNAGVITIHGTATGAGGVSVAQGTNIALVTNAGVVTIHGTATGSGVSVAQGTNIALVTNAGVVTIHGTATGSGIASNALGPALTWPNDGVTWDLVLRDYSLEWTNQLGASWFRFPYLAGEETPNGVATLNNVTNTVTALAGSLLGLSTLAYYVSATGNDATAEAGRPDKPWLTLSNAVQAVGNDSVIVVQPGNYTNNHIGHSWIAGSTSSIPIFGKTNLSIVMSGARLYWPTQFSGIFIMNCSNVLVQGGELAHGRFYETNNWPNYGISNWFEAAGGPVFGMLEVGNGVQGLTIRGVKFVGGYDHGILARDTSTATNGITVEGCEFWGGGNLWTNLAAARGWPDGGAVIPLNGWTVRNNYVNGWGRGIEVFPITDTGDRRFPPVTIMNNTVLNTLDFAFDFERCSLNAVGNVAGRDPAGTWGSAPAYRFADVDGLFSGNASRQYTEGLRTYCCTNLLILGNRFEDAAWGVNIGGETPWTDWSERINISGNSFVNMTNQGIRFSAHGRDFIINDNLFFNAGTDSTYGYPIASAASVGATLSNATIRGNHFINTALAANRYAIKWETDATDYAVRMEGNRRFGYDTGLATGMDRLEADDNVRSLAGTVSLSGNVTGAVFTATGGGFVGNGAGVTNLPGTNVVYALVSLSASDMTNYVVDIALPYSLLSVGTNEVNVLHSTNRVGVKSSVMFVENYTGSNIALSLPTNTWRWIGTRPAQPVTLTNGYVAVVSLTSRGTAETNVYASLAFEAP